MFLSTNHHAASNMQTAEKSHTRREPRQQRSRHTIDCVLEAVPLVARRHGAAAITTNRIAETAGVSVGSLYQYFPDKRAIYSALHERHVDAVRQVIEQTIADCATEPLQDIVRELMHGLVNAHAEGADLHDLVASAVPGSARGFADALDQTFSHVLSHTGDPERYSPDEIERMLFVLPRMVAALVHGAHAPLSRDGASSEAIRAVVAYVNSVEAGTPNRY